VVERWLGDVPFSGRHAALTKLSEADAVVFVVALNQFNAVDGNYRNMLSVSLQYFESVVSGLMKSGNPTPRVVVWFSCPDVVQSMCDFHSGLKPEHLGGAFPELVDSKSVDFNTLLSAYVAKFRKQAEAAGVSPVFVVANSLQSKAVTRALVEKVLRAEGDLVATCVKGRNMTPYFPERLLFGPVLNTSDFNKLFKSNPSPLRRMHGDFFSRRRLAMTTLSLVSTINKYPEQAILNLPSSQADINSALLFIEQCPEYRSRSIPYENFLRVLVGSRANIDVKDSGGRSMLVHAFCNGDLPLVRTLLLSHADANQIVNSDGANLAIMAARRNDVDLLSLLGQCAVDLRKPDRYGRTPAFLCSIYENVIGLSILSRCGASLGATFATLNQTSFELNLLDSSGLTMVAQACIHGKPETLRVLIEYKADMNKPTREGDSASLLACKHGTSECLALLAEHKADLTGDVTRRPALVAAALGRDSCLAILGSNFVDLKQPDSNGWPPAFLARRHAACTSVLAAFKADLRSALQELVANRGNLNGHDNDGMTMVSRACADNALEALRMLLEVKADPNALTKDMQSPAMVACEYSSATCLALLAEHKGQ
jgi:ankyrin repeat protein